MAAIINPLNTTQATSRPTTDVSSEAIPLQVILHTSAAMDMDKNKKGTAPFNKPTRRRRSSTRRRRSLAGLEPGSTVVWAGDRHDPDGTVYSGIALQQDFASHAYTIKTGRGGGRLYKEEVIRISSRCPVPCLHLHYVSPFTGHVFVSKMDVVLLLARDFDGKVLEQICSYFPCPALLPGSVALF